MVPNYFITTFPLPASKSTETEATCSEHWSTPDDCPSDLASQNPSSWSLAIRELTAPSTVTPWPCSPNRSSFGTALICIFLKNGSIPASFSVYFRISTWHNSNLNFKSVDGELGIQTQSGRLEGEDESTELRRHPIICNFVFHFWIRVISHLFFISFASFYELWSFSFLGHFSIKKTSSYGIKPGIISMITP